MRSAPLGSPRWLKDELLDKENFYSLREAHPIIESWHWHSKTVRSHAPLGYRPLALEALALEVFVPAFGLAACTTSTGSA
jgi:hypothetical protein